MCALQGPTRFAKTSGDENTRPQRENAEGDATCESRPAIQGAEDADRRQREVLQAAWTRHRDCADHRALPSRTSLRTLKERSSIDGFSHASIASRTKTRPRGSHPKRTRTSFCDPWHETGAPSKARASRTSP